MGGGGVAPTLAGLVWDEANVGEPLYDDGVGGKEDGDEEEEAPPPPAPAPAAAEVGRAGEQRDVAEGLVGGRAAAEGGDVPVIDTRNEATTDGEGEGEEEEEEGTAEDDGAEGVPGARGGGEEEANEARGEEEEEEARVVERAEVAEEDDDDEEEEDWRVRRRASRRERRRAVCASSFGRVE